MAFTAADAAAIFAALSSHAQKLAIFDRVNTHAPQNAPGNGLSCSILLGPFAADPSASGLAKTAARITFLVHIHSSLMQKPLDGIDPAALGAAAVLLNEYNGAFTLGGLVRDIDVLQASAQPGYLAQDGKEYRVIQISLPVVINDAWTQVP